MKPLQQLAGQTAIYGISSILGRLLNYLLVPLHTRIFINPSEYGVVNEMYAYVSFLIVILTYGMETAFFKFSQDEKAKNSVYSTALASLIITSSFFVVLLWLFSKPISVAIRYPNNSEYIIWFAWIIALDALSSIPFAKLRAQNKALRFAVIKFVNITTNIVFNLFFLVLCPYLQKNGILSDFINLFYSNSIGVGYIFISNLIASIVTILLLIPDMIILPSEFNYTLWKRMIRYGLPLLIFGLAGIINETIDRIFIKYLLSPDEAMTQLGIYGACYKIAIMMTICIQAFRYAAEPFFFSQSKELNAKVLYAEIMKIFVIVLLFIFLVIMLYIDFVKYFIGESYHSGIKVVPILLCANLFLGITYNLSIWYKLTDKTLYGAYISIFGASITILLNIILIPIFGYMGAAWATLICYFCMMVSSYFGGQKYYTVNYDLRSIITYFVLAMILYFISSQPIFSHKIYSIITNTFLLFIFVFIVWKKEKKNINYFMN